jgi:uncharacterized protein with PIN domain
MKFIADSMLGRLSRWLRLLGYDTLYFPHIENRSLLKIARESKRILLTRDTHLVKVRGIENFLLLKDNDPFKQLRSVIAEFRLDVGAVAENLNGHAVLSRCTVCNSCLDNITREEVRDSIPEYVYRTSSIFRKCSGCGKLYWDGTHPGKFRKKLSEVLRGSPESSS